MADPTTSLPGGARVTHLPPLPPGWLRSRPPRYWVVQVLAYLPAVLVDWLLTTVDVSNDGAFFGHTTPWAVLAVYAVVYLPLLVRRRWPLAALGCALVVSLVMTTTGLGQPFLGLLVALHAVAALLPLAWSQVALFLAIIPGLVQAYWTYLTIDGQPDLIDFLVPAIFFTGLTVVVWLVGRHEHATRLSALSLHRQVELSESVATDRERRRIAHELHDILSHSVSAMMMQAAGARALTRSLGKEHPEFTQLTPVENALTTIEQTGSQSLRELHRLLGALRDTAGIAPDSHPLPDGDQPLDLEGSEKPTHLELHQLVESSSRAGLSVQLHHIGEHRALDPSVGTAAYRVVQESLTNALKHGGRGSIIDIYETWQENHLQLQVRSKPGQAHPDTSPPGSGTGLLGLRERVELAGGTFESGWVRDDFVTTAVLPLDGSTRKTRPEGDR